VSFANSVDVVTVSDFNDPVDWGPILHGMDIVCHVAGYAHADYPDDAHANRVNVTTTRERKGFGPQAYSRLRRRFRLQLNAVPNHHII
jgi:uncharacterized protein YbjT (DUF2867 family)